MLGITGLESKSICQYLHIHSVWSTEYGGKQSQQYHLTVRGGGTRFLTRICRNSFVSAQKGTGKICVGIVSVYDVYVIRGSRGQPIQFDP